jgi:hypothetical protein
MLIMTLSKFCVQVKNKGVSPCVTKIGQALQNLDVEGSHASVSHQYYEFVDLS